MELSPLQRDAFQEIANIGAGNATIALANLINSKIEVNAPATRLVTLGDIPEIVGHPEDTIITAYMKVLGGAPGIFLIIFPEDDVFGLLELITGQKTGKVKKLGHLEQLTIMQLATILSSSYFYALSRFIKTRIVPEQPQLICDMRDAVLNSIKSIFDKTCENSFLIKTELTVAGMTKGKGHLFFIPNPETFDVVLDAINIMSQAPLQLQEKRIHPRVLAVELETSFRQKETREWHEAICGNISLNGMLLIVEKLFPVNTTIEITIHVLDESTIFTIEGEVMWHQKLEPSTSTDRYKIGVKLTKIDEDCRAVLEEFINRKIMIE